MPIKSNSDVVIYHVVLMLANPAEYFAKSEYRRRRREKEIEIYKDEISNPEISLEGLKNRSSSLWLVMVQFLIFGGTLQIILGLAIAVFQLPGSWAAPIFSFCFYFISTSLVIWFRYCISIKDYKKFEKLQKTNSSIVNFKVSPRAEPKLRDLFPGILFAALFYLFLRSDFHVNS